VICDESIRSGSTSFDGSGSTTDLAAIDRRERTTSTTTKMIATITTIPTINGA